MKPLIFIFSILSTILFFGCSKDDGGSTGGVFYYYDHKKEYIQPDYQTISLILKSDDSLATFENILSAGEKTAYTIEINTIEVTDSLSGKNADDSQLIYTEIKYDSQQGKGEIKKRVNELMEYAEVIMASHGFLSADGKPMGISNKFYVKLRNGGDAGKLYNMAKEYGVEILGRNSFMPLWYSVVCDKRSRLNTIDTANAFYESNLFDASEPEFMLHGLLNNVWKATE